MSDRYSPMGNAAMMLCHDCGAVVYWDKDHDAFHRRFERLEQHLSPTITLGESHRLSVNGHRITATDWQAAHDAPHDDPCDCDDCRYAVAYEAGRRDQKAEWQTVLASTNTRARIDALKQARDFLLAHDRSTTLTQLNAWMVQP